jgi:hypothetical protein
MSGKLSDGKQHATGIFHITTDHNIYGGVHSDGKALAKLIGLPVNASGVSKVSKQYLSRLGQFHFSAEPVNRVDTISVVTPAEDVSLPFPFKIPSFIKITPELVYFLLINESVFAHTFDSMQHLMRVLMDTNTVSTLLLAAMLWKPSMQTQDYNALLKLKAGSETVTTTPKISDEATEFMKKNYTDYAECINKIEEALFVYTEKVQGHQKILPEALQFSFRNDMRVPKRGTYLTGAPLRYIPKEKEDLGGAKFVLTPEIVVNQTRQQQQQT